MLRARSLLPALVAVAAVLGLGLGPAAGAWADSPVRAAAGPAAYTPLGTGLRSETAPTGGTPLKVEIDSLAPSTVPTTGRIRVSGTLTNRDDQTWTMVNLYAFVSKEPLLTSGALARAAATPASEQVGQRILTPGTYATVARIRPGQRVDFHFSVPHALLGAKAPGVYWFGVHALGASPQGRDEIADGRARTFLPSVPAGTRPVQASVVVPLRREVAYAADGTVSDLAGWTETLGPHGRLGALLGLGAAAEGRPVSWLVDPAVLDAVRRLAAGNPPRSIADTVGRGQVKPTPGATPPTATQPGDPLASGVPSAADDGTTDGASADLPTSTTSTDPATRQAAVVAAAWLARLRSTLTGSEVLALPYGDLDVSAAAEHDHGLYAKARALSAAAMSTAGLRSTPAVGSPSGYLDALGLASVHDDATVLATDLAFGAHPPAVAEVDGHRVVVTSSGAAAGGPGPGDPLSQVGLRQRILAEAAVRALAPGGHPLVVVLPGTWSPRGGPGLWSGLQVPWLALTSVAAVAQTPARTIAPAALTYPPTQHRAELHQPAFDALDSLARSGRTLQNILPRNDTVGGEVFAQALTGVSYADRPHPRLARAAAAAAQAWVHGKLDAVRVKGPVGVTLSSGSGRFAATVANDLPVAVRVIVEGKSDDRLTITPDTLDVPAHSHQSVLLDARTTSPGVHTVQLVLADGTGTRFHPSPAFPVRSAQVSRVIWLFIGGGLALLFGAAGVRLVRRLRAAARERRAPASPTLAPHVPPGPA